MSKIITKSISLITNLSFSSGTFPNNLRIANVIPIFKKDDRTISSNYRPIPLLSNIRKITEKLILTRLTMFLNNSTYYMKGNLTFDLIIPRHMHF